MEAKSRLWFSVLTAMFLPFLISIFYFIIFSDSPLGRVLYGGAKLFTLIWPIVAYCLILKQPLPQLNLTDRKHLRALPLGLLSGLLLVLIFILLLGTPLGTLVESSIPRIREKAVQLGFLEHYLLFGVFLSVFHSLLEEYYWRWFVYGTLRTIINPRAASILAAISFALHHIVVGTQFFPVVWGVVLGSLVGVGGLIWNEMYQRQQTLIGAWVSHIAVDVGILSIGYYYLFPR